MSSVPLRLREPWAFRLAQAGAPEHVDNSSQWADISGPTGMLALVEGTGVLCCCPQSLGLFRCFRAVGTRRRPTMCLLMGATPAASTVKGLPSVMFPRACTNALGQAPGLVAHTLHACGGIPGRCPARQAAQIHLPARTWGLLCSG